MRLRTLHVEGFTQLEQLDLSFRDDAPNLIIGPNEAGKSHLMLALYGIIFGLEHPERYTPWIGEPTMRGSLDFEDDRGQLIRLERRLLTNEITVTSGTEAPWSAKAGPKDRLPAAQDYFRRVEGWLGFRDTQIFTSTTFVQQSDVVQASMQGIAPQVKSLITGSGDANYSTVLTDLETRLDDLRKRTPRMKSRRLEQKQEELATLRQRHSVATVQHAKVAELKQSGDQLTAEIAAASTLLAENRQHLDRIGDLVKREADVAVVERRFSEQQARLDRFTHQREVLRLAETSLATCSPAASVDSMTLMRLESGTSKAQALVHSLGGEGDLATTDTAAIEALDPPVQAAEDALKAIDTSQALHDTSLAALTELESELRMAQDRVRAFESQGATPEIDPIELAGLDGAVTEAETRLRLIEQQKPRRGSSIDSVTLGIAGVGVVIAIVLTVTVTPLALALLVPLAALVYYRSRAGGTDEGVPEKTVSEARRAVEGARQTRTDALARLGVTSVAEAMKLRDRYEQARGEEANAQGRLEGALQRLGVPTIEAARLLLGHYDVAQTALARLGAATVEDALARRLRYNDALATAAAAEGERDAILRRLGMTSIAAALTARAAYDEAEVAVRAARAALAALGDEDRAQQEWQKARQELSMKQAHVERVLDEHVGLKLQAPEMRAAEAQRLEEAVAELTVRLETMKAQKDEVDRALYVIRGVGEEDVAGLALAIAEAEADIARIELQVRALTEAISALHGAVQEFQDNCLDGVTSTASHLLEQITGGRYTRVHLSDDTLEPRVDTRHRAGIGVSDLSRGMRDQLYFSLRIALAEALAGGKTLPLMLDDPFVNFDADRLERTVNLLHHLVQRTQIILFTCDPRYKQWMQPILELPRTEVDRAPLQTSGAA